jgi:predicted transposase/invertase (TIGR01784 family)
MVNEKTPPDIKVWLELVLDSLDGEIDESRYTSPVFEKVIDAVIRENISPGELRVLKDEEDWEDSLVYEHRRGLEEGHEKGLEAGSQQTTEKIALALISEGLDTEFIARTTGMPETEIEKLRQS